MTELIIFVSKANTRGTHSSSSPVIKLTTLNA